MEADLKKKIQRLIEDRGGFWSAVKGGEYSKPGDPDIIACYRGYFIAIEGKSATGSPSEEQEDCREWIVDAGGIHIYAYNLDVVRATLDMIEVCETMGDADGSGRRSPLRHHEGP